MKISVAIDGPVGSGKSTVAKAVAEAANIIYIDTGAMYRAVALYNIRTGVNLTDKKAVENTLANIYIDIKHDAENRQRLILNGEDVSDKLRTLEAGEGASTVAVIQAVREKLVALQQNLAKKYDAVMDGRDIGTHVLPNAQVKIYLDASVEERTHRRCSELEKIGEEANFEQVQEAIKIRDERDMNREFSPLVKAEDAIYLTTDGLTVQEITNMIIDKMKKVRG